MIQLLQSKELPKLLLAGATWRTTIKNEPISIRSHVPVQDLTEDLGETQAPETVEASTTFTEQERALLCCVRS